MSRLHYGFGVKIFYNEKIPLMVTIAYNLLILCRKLGIRDEMAPILLDSLVIND